MHFNIFNTANILPGGSNYLNIYYIHYRLQIVIVSSKQKNDSNSYNPIEFSMKCMNLNHVSTNLTLN